MELKDLNNIADEESFDPLAFEENQVLKKKIQNTLSLLKRAQRRCFCLFYIQGKSYKDIVKITGYSYPGVRSAIQNARRNFKVLFDREGIEFE